MAKKPPGVYASLYQSPDDGKVLLVLMNTSGKDQQIHLPMTLDKSTEHLNKCLYYSYLLFALKLHPYRLLLQPVLSF